ncbi:alpha/beta-hydrolase [Aspergillus pseudodeflectus]|uniref:Alpha/beta-hydrolase n=1 Tax=Aspergillus pseudodeflectus TaxID=176178 RepID=A0ABR4JXB0_9EURO
MAGRLAAVSVALLLALVAVYFQQLLNDFLVPRPTVVDSARDITYIGSRSASVEHFQNIFYADEPTGKRRFAPPVPIKHAKGSVIDATQSGAWCPQGTGDILPFTSRVTNISENCLSLRIARPKGTQKNAQLPVVVWLHGGGHALGSGSDILYEPDGLVGQSSTDGTPLIYVAINYRLGLFGFATSRELIERKETNAGLRDQRAALEWVRDNIESFGGDPNQVTAIGQSVGSSDIGLQLLAFGGAEGAPFQQAVMMSAGPGVNFNSHPDMVANNTATVAKQVGCVKDDDDQGLQTLRCLREIPFEGLTNFSVAASRIARPPFGEGFFYPTIDNDFLQDRPSQLMRAGKFAKGIPIIASWVTNEGAWYVPSSTSTDEEVLGSFGLWLSNLSDDTKQKLLELYPLEDFVHSVRADYDGPISPQWYRAAQMSRDIWFTCTALEFTWLYLRYGPGKPSQIRLYEFNQTMYIPVWEAMGVPMWRVAHLSDIPYLFNNHHLGGGTDNSEPHIALAQDFSKTIIEFVNNASPGESTNGTGLWRPAYSTATSGQDWFDELSIQLFGGPYGSELVTVSKDGDKNAKTDAEKAVYWEKLFGRCEFINGQQMRAEAGV